jgi:hypothetical protein
MAPIGAGLQEPPFNCWPFVIGSGTVRQKLMKLLLEVRDGTWPAVAFSCPFCSKPLAMTFGSRAKTDAVSTMKLGKVYCTY